MTRNALRSMTPAVLLGVIVVTLAPTPGRAQGSPGEARATLAERIYTRLESDTVKLLSAPSATATEQNMLDRLDSARAERFSFWSRRWMEARRDVGRTKEQRDVAIKDHLERMKAQEEGSLLKQWAESRGLPEPFNEATSEEWGKSDFAASMKYLRLEAESWLAEAEKSWSTPVYELQ